MGADEEDFEECTCPICMEEIRDACTTPCNHTFCKQCITLVLFSSSTSSEHCPSCRGAIDASVVKVISTGRTLLPSPAIIGSVYTQGNTEGLASYHFVSEDDCYISYESPQCSMWPDLDNGDRPPAKKPFTNISLNEDDRIFKGDIVWCPTSWHGNVVWCYEMHFAEDYATITGGQVVKYDDMERETITGTSTFGDNLRYKRSLRHDYLMILSNPKIIGGVYVQFNTLGLASYHFESEEDCYISYSSPQCSAWPDLDNGERPPVKKPFTNIQIDEENRVFKGDILWAPASWSGDVLWSYEMHFSQDYGTILSGKCEAFDALENGSIRDVHVFGTHLIYKRNIFHELLPAHM